MAAAISREALADAPELGYVGAFVALWPAEPRPKWTTGCGSPRRSPRRPEQPAGRMPDGTTSYEVNVNSSARRSSTGTSARRSQSPSGWWRRNPGGANGEYRRSRRSPSSGTSRATPSRASRCVRALGDRDAPRRPHGAILALATLSLIELDEGTREGCRTARRALDVAASAASQRASPPGWHTSHSGEVSSPSVVPRRACESWRSPPGCSRGAPRSRITSRTAGLAEAQRPTATSSPPTLGGCGRAADRVLRRRRDLPGDARRGEARRRCAQRRRAAPGAELSESELAVLGCWPDRSRDARSPPSCAFPRTP